MAIIFTLRRKNLFPPPFLKLSKLPPASQQEEDPSPHAGIPSRTHPGLKPVKELRQKRRPLQQRRQLEMLVIGVNAVPVRPQTVERRDSRSRRA